MSAHAIGPLQRVGLPPGTSRPEMIGAFLEPGSTSAVLDVPAVELTDQVVSLEDLWGSPGARLAENLVDLDEASRVDRLETALLERIRCVLAPRASIDVVGLARWAREEPATMSTRRLAQAAGVSRQHLTRVFRQVIGISPKRYCRLTRFQAGLVYGGVGIGVNWARVAMELGYSDQSHMIAEFRELCGVTPQMLATQRWFHPFILEARSRVGITKDSSCRCS